MSFYLVYPDLQKRRPHWPRYGQWYQGMDLPPGTYWHPRYSIKPYYKERNRQDRQVLPGDIIELVVVVTEDRSKTYHGLPLCRTQDHIRVLRRVRLTHAYTYEELSQSPLYQRWRTDGTLQEYDIRPLPPALPRKRRQKKKKRRT